MDTLNTDAMTTNEATKSALIGLNIDYIRKDIVEIKSSIKDLSGVYATQAVVEEMRKLFDARLDVLEKASNLWKWLSPTLSALFSATLTFLLLSYIQHLK